MEQGGRSTIPVTILAGPPGAGKTTYLQDVSRPGDVVVDVDALYVALTGLPIWDKPQSVLPFVLAARDAVIERLCRSSAARHAWIATTEGPDRIAQLQAHLGAELVVLNVSAHVCIQRIQSNPARRVAGIQWEELVRRWHENWKGSILAAKFMPSERL